ncbi:MAG: menaquinone biosynthesis decarboxylase [Dehalococcoidia bacterium]|nr:menaquinone biosynthesis decarboxylase [Dehalococcoidia bacterium]
MAYKDLREFLSFLEKRGQLKRIKAQVDPELEITEITDRVCKANTGNVALLFENVRGSSMPVLMNMYGSEERMSWALGVDRLDELGDRVAGLLKMDPPGGIMDGLQKLGRLTEVARFRPKIVSDAPCQEVVETNEPSLADIPILKCWPQDGGRYITLPLVVTRDPETGRRNVGMYRLQVYDDRTLGMHWHIHKVAAEHYRHGEAGSRRLEVAIALGGDPATIYTGSAPLPPMVDEFLFAGWLRRSRVELVKAVTVDLEVPAHAEIVLEGYVDPLERHLEGPFGDHTGYYSLPDEYPVFHLTAVTRRKSPIYPSIIVGKPPMEDCYMGTATERIFLPIIKVLHPEVVDMSMPYEGGFHNLVIVSVKKSYPGQTRKVMYGLWGMGLMSLNKMMVVVDADVDVRNLREVLWRLTNNVDPRRDFVMVDGPLDALDHSSPFSHYGSKVGIDATKKGPMDGHTRPWPDDIVMDKDVVERVNRKWRELGLNLG